MSRVAVYKRGSFPGQIDHPGWLSKVVDGVEALDEALADGWKHSMADPPMPQTGHAAQPVAEPPADEPRRLGRRRMIAQGE